MTFALKFWGVRGTIAVSTPDHIAFGGNTSCIEMVLGDRRLILDAGTGLRALGEEYLRQDVRAVEILLTHTHWDHINGFPTFAPAYDPKRSVHVRTGHLRKMGGIRRVMARQMDSPMFPVPMDAMLANLRFEDFDAGDRFDIFPDVKVRTAPLNHPNGATGYRIEYDGRAVCYVTDTEHVPGAPDQNILELIEGADLVIYDSTYTEDEFPNHVGWGHSTCAEGIRLCRAANVKRMAIFHHEPGHDDTIMAGIEEAARTVWSETFAARDNMTVTLD